MFTLKPIVTTIILMSSILIPNLARAYPKTSQNSELEYLKASITNMYGDISPEMLNHLEQLYNNQDSSTELMLSGGYQICDGIKLANANGMDSKTFIEQEITNISQIANNILQQQGMSLTEEQITTAYQTANNHLCPELN